MCGSAGGIDFIDKLQGCLIKGRIETLNIYSNTIKVDGFAYGRVRELREHLGRLPSLCGDKEAVALWMEEHERLIANLPMSDDNWPD